MGLMRIEENSYFNDSRRRFVGEDVEIGQIHKVLDFAYDMCFGIGHHRNHRTGGQVRRKAGEQFCNTFQGKLAEICLRKKLLDCGLDCGEPDFAIYGEGVWDDTDLVVNGKTVSVKSAASFSNLLLLETKDYDFDGRYLPNLNIGATSSFDFYVLVRINPDIKSLFRTNRLMFSDNIEKQVIENIVNAQRWSFDVAGWISKQEFVEVIRSKQIIPQNALLNGTTKMDAENYYVQSGDMHDISSIIPLLEQ